MLGIGFDAPTYSRKWVVRFLFSLSLLLGGSPWAGAQWETVHDDRIVIWRTRLPGDAVLPLAETILPYPELVAKLGGSASRHYYYDRHGTNVFTAVSESIPDQATNVTLSGFSVPLVLWENLTLVRHGEYSFERRRSKGVRTANLVLTEKDYIEFGTTTETARRSEYVTVDDSGRTVSTQIIQSGAGTTAPTLDLVLHDTRPGGIRVWRLVVPGAIPATSPSEVHVPLVSTGDRPFALNEHVWYRVDATTLELQRLGFPDNAGTGVALLLEGSKEAAGPYEPRQWIREGKSGGNASFYRLRPEVAR